MTPNPKISRSRSGSWTKNLPNKQQCIQRLLSPRAIVMDPDWQLTDVQKKAKAAKTIKNQDYLTVEIPTVGKGMYDQYDLFMPLKEGQTEIMLLGPDEFPSERAVFIFRLDLEQLSPLYQLMRRNGVLNTLYIITPKSW